MKILKGLTILLISLIFTPGIINAQTCSNEDRNRLNRLANNIRAEVSFYTGIIQVPNYFTDEEIIIEPYINREIDFFSIEIFNLSPELRMEVINNNDNEAKNFAYNDTSNGNVTFQTPDPFKTTRYTINVFGNEGLCQDLIRTMEIIAPRFNAFIEYPVCQNEGRDFLWCQRHLTTEREIDVLEFFDRVDKYLEEQEDVEEIEEKTSILSFLLDLLRYWYIFVPILLVISGIIVIIVIQRRRSRLV